MEKILDKLELSEDVRGALVNRGGSLALPLQLVEAYERANWEVAQEIAERNHLAGDKLPDMYVDALKWASERVDGE